MQRQNLSLFRDVCNTSVPAPQIQRKIKYTYEESGKLHIINKTDSSFSSVITLNDILKQYFCLLVFYGKLGLPGRLPNTKVEHNTPYSLEPVHEV